MKLTLILVALLGILGCKAQSHKEERLKVEFARIKAVQLPNGCPLLEDPLFNEEASEWPATVVVSGRKWDAYQVDSLLSSSYIRRDLPGPAEVGDSIPLTTLGTKARAVLDAAVLDFELYRKNPNLVPQGYSVVGKDTVVYLRAATKHDTMIYDEMVSYISYTLLATVKDGRLSDFIVLDYYITRMYDQPVRHFYIHDQVILLTTVYFGETAGLEGFETWEIKNHQFVRKQ